MALKKDYPMNMLNTARTVATRGNAVIITARGNDGISLDEIAARCPSVFADQAHESRSARYVHLDTTDMLNGLLKEGFKVMEVRQGGSRIEGKHAFTKHALRLSAPDSLTIEPRPGDRSAAQVVLKNAHDGTSSWQLRAGWYRFLCLNGLVVGDDYMNVKVGHTAKAKDQIIDAAYKVLGEMPRAMDEIRSFAGTELSVQERLIFAQSARELRWTPTEDKRAPVEPARLLAPRRREDNGGDLWSVMNVVQEHLIKGGDRYTAPQVMNRGTAHEYVRQTTRTVGAVQSIDDDSKINRALWTLTQEMAKLKAAA